MTRVELIDKLRDSSFKDAVATGQVRTCQLIRVVQLEFVRGLGVEGDPIRLVTQYWTEQGVLIAEQDPEA